MSTPNGHAVGASASVVVTSSARQQQHGGAQQRRRVVVASDQQTLAAARALAALPQTPVPPQKLYVGPPAAGSHQQPVCKIVSIESKAAPAMANGSAANGVSINSLLPTVPVPPSAINGVQQQQQQQQHATVVAVAAAARPLQTSAASTTTTNPAAIVIHGQGQQQQQQARPRVTCQAEVVTNSMKTLRQKGSSFLRTHASKHGITNASRKLTSQVLNELTQHYLQVHMVPMMVQESSTAVINAVAAAPAAAEERLNGHHGGNNGQAATLQVVSASRTATVPASIMAVASHKPVQPQQQTIQIQLPQQHGPPQLSYMTPISSSSAAPAGAAPAVKLEMTPVTLAAAAGQPSTSSLVSILPKHPLPQAHLIVAASSSPPTPAAAAASSVTQKLAQLRPNPPPVAITQIKAPVPAAAVTPAAAVSKPPSVPISTIIFPTRPVTPPARAPATSTSERNPVESRSRPAGVANVAHRPPCSNGVVAKTRAELAACGTSMLRPEAAAHKVHNASRKPKEQVIEELWQHYVACHSNLLSADPATGAAASSTSSTAVTTAASSSPAAAAAHAVTSSSSPAPAKRRRTTIAQVAEAASAVVAAEGWVGNVVDDDEDKG